MVEPSRHFDVDPFRGWVCLSILVMHFYFSTISSELIPLLGTDVAWFVAHFRLGFESFFVLAGFFLAHSFRESTKQYLSAKSFLHRRLLRLLVPYWVVLVLAFLNSWLPNVILDHHNPLPTVPQFVAMLLCVQNFFQVSDLNFTHWSMTVLIQTYFLWAFLFWLVRKWLMWNHSPHFHERTEAILRLLIVGIGLVAIPVFAVDGPTFGKLLPNLPYVGLGVCLYSASLQNRGWISLLILGAVNLTLGFMEENSRRFASIVSMLILLYIGWGGQFSNCAFCRVLAFFGKRSYSIYLTHATVGYRIINLTNHLEPSIWTSVGLFLLAVIVSLVAAELFYRFVEEPQSQRVKKIQYRR